MTARRPPVPPGQAPELAGPPTQTPDHGEPPPREHVVLDLRLLGPALVAWVVLAATLGLPVRAHVALATTAGVGAAACLSRGRSGRHRVALGVGLVLAVVALLQVCLAGHQLSRATGTLPQLTAARAVATLDVVVTSDPLRLTGGRQDGAVWVRARAERVQGRAEVSPARAPILVRGDDRLGALRFRQRVRLTGRLAPTDPWRAETASLHVTGPPQVLAPPGLVARGAERLREGLRRATEPVPADARGLLPGLVIGDTSRTPAELTAAMLATGMTHLTAVSGSNVAVVLGLVLATSAMVGVPRRARPVLALAALAGFVVLARPEPSVVRAAAMGAIGLIGLSRSHRAAGPPVLAGAVVVVLGVDPWLSRSYGFALSTLATLGLLLFTRPWGDAIGAHLPGPLRRFGPAVAIPVAAQMMCAPVIVLLQGSVTVVGVLANLVAAPLVAPATIAGVAAALVAVVSEPLARGLAWAGAVPTLGIARTARALADVPGGTAPWPDGAGGALLLAALTVLALATGGWVRHKVVAHPLRWASAALVTAALLTPTRVATWPPPGWRMVFCDVGQGDAAVLRSGEHSAVLVDAGPEPGAVDRCLDRLDVDRLDAVVLTHFHADHVEGMPGALRGRAVGQVLTTPVRDPPHQSREVESWARARGIPVGTVDDGDRIDLGEVHARVWAPARRITAGSVPNNASVVLAVGVGDVDALLLGDVEREAGHDLLLRLRRDPRMAERAGGFEVVKTPHHGSANLDAGLMGVVRSPISVVSVGADNDYGHPTAAHLALLRANGSTAYRTDHRGDIAVVERPEGVGVVTSR